MTNVYPLPRDKSHFTAAEVEVMMQAHVDGMREAFDEMVEDMEQRYRKDMDAFMRSIARVDATDRWAMRFMQVATWASFWFSGYFMRGLTTYWGM